MESKIKQIEKAYQRDNAELYRKWIRAERQKEILMSELKRVAKNKNKELLIL